MFEQVDWHAVFTPHVPWLEIFVRGTLVYLSLFLLLRVLLKRESGTLGITDTLLIVLIADASQNGMANDYKSVTDGFVLVVTLLFWSLFLNWLSFRFPFFERLLKPRKLLLIKNGRMLKENMRKELITYSELMSEVRTNGLSDLSSIKEAYIEPSGVISIVSFDESQSKRESKKVV